MDFIQLLILLAYIIAMVTGVRSMCNTTHVMHCFKNLTRDLPGNQVDGNQLMNFINPSQLHGDQVNMCGEFRRQDFGWMRECVRGSQCADVSIHKQPADNSLPHFTWMMLLRSMRGICSPGCENLEAKTKAAEKCNSEFDTCTVIEESYACYRREIGSCEVLVIFIGNMLNNMGIHDLAKDHCPDLDYSLQALSGKARTLSYSGLALFSSVMTCHLLRKLRW